MCGREVRGSCVDQVLTPFSRTTTNGGVQKEGEFLKGLSKCLKMKGVVLNNNEEQDKRVNIRLANPKKVGFKWVVKNKFSPIDSLVEVGEPSTPITSSKGETQEASGEASNFSLCPFVGQYGDALYFGAESHERIRRGEGSGLGILEMEHLDVQQSVSGWDLVLVCHSDLEWIFGGK